MTREEAVKELELIAQVTMWNDRQEAVNNTPIEVGKWHCFDLPFIIMTGDKATAEYYRDMLSAYDWKKCKECLQIGWGK